MALSKHGQLTQCRLKEVLGYNPETGVFVWLAARGNAIAGAVAGSTDGNGYRSVAIDGRRYLMHRLAWLYVWGEFPPCAIDHRDHDKANNRIANLRAVNGSQNQQNRLLQANNKSGYRGVVWNKGVARWQSSIQVNGTRTHIGLFDTPESAYAAYQAAAARMHTHNPAAHARLEQPCA